MANTEDSRSFMLHYYLVYVDKLALRSDRSSRSMLLFFRLYGILYYDYVSTLYKEYWT